MNRCLAEYAKLDTLDYNDCDASINRLSVTMRTLIGHKQ